MVVETAVVSILTTKLGEILSKSIVDRIINEKEKASKEKEKNKIVREYTRIIDELIAENLNLFEIASVYKNLYEKNLLSEQEFIEIKDAILDLLKIDLIKSHLDENYIKLISNLLNEKNLDVLQSMGFNYKQAIGEPLTEYFNSFIKSWGNLKLGNNATKYEFDKNAKSKLEIKFVELSEHNITNNINFHLTEILIIDDNDKIKNSFNVILNKLIQENWDLRQIAENYKSLYDGIILNDDEIKKIKEPFENIYDFFNDKDKENFKLILDLINENNLKALQLIGFNYKKAIGEPLTEIFNAWIKSWKLTQKVQNQKNRKKI